MATALTPTTEELLNSRTKRTVREFASSRVRQLSSSSVGGWTLIELLIVLAIILILASMSLNQYRNSIVTAKEAALHTDLYLMRDAIDQYYADKAKYPESLEALVSEGYLRRIPDDPITRSATTWQTVPADTLPTAGTANSGIYDVKSGADGIALDGRRYSDF